MVKEQVGLYLLHCEILCNAKCWSLYFLFGRLECLCWELLVYDATAQERVA